MGDDPMPDDLMSKFDAIERMLTARRQTDRAQERPEQERPAEQDSGDEADAARSPRAPRRLHRSRPRREQVIISALSVVALAAGGVGVALASTHRGGANGAAQPSSSPSSSMTGATLTTAELEAAKWVSIAVGTTHKVACDADLCALLKQDGVSATSTIASESDVSAIASADVVVATAASRAALGTALASITSAQPLASFGSGADLVEVRAVTPHGTADYTQRLTQDRAARKRVGADLIHNPRIAVSNPNQSIALADGMVDSRLCSLLALLGASHTVALASFGAPGPGSGPDIPTATMVLFSIDGRSATGTSPQARSLLALLAAQKPPYRPAAAVAEPNGLRITFTQPEPLGLLAAASP